MRTEEEGGDMLTTDLLRSLNRALVAIVVIGGLLILAIVK